MQEILNIDWEKYKAVIFDVDGTLYDQYKLRGKMTQLLLNYYALRPWEIYDLQIIRVFRKERELMHTYSFKNIEEKQFEICAKKTHTTPGKVKSVITKWMYEMPLPYLAGFRYPGLKNFFATLKKQGLKIAVYSDYPAADKLNSLQLPVDLAVCSTDQEIDALKPNPKGLKVISNHLNVPVEHCFFIGDRDELDGACARSIGMSYYILNRNTSREAYDMLNTSLKIFFN